MARMLGMDPERVENLATRLKTQDARLSQVASLVDRAALASASPLSWGIQPGGMVIAPFSIAMTTGAAVKVRLAMSSADALIGKLFREVAQQRFTSLTDRNFPNWLPFPFFDSAKKEDTSFWAGMGGLWAVVTRRWGYYQTAQAVVDTAKGVAGVGFVVKSVRDATSVRALTQAMHFSKTFSVLDKISGAMQLGKNGGKVLAGIGVGIDLVDTITAATQGRTGDAIWSGAKTLIGAASFLPPPAGTVAAVVSVGITVVENWDSIVDGVGKATSWVGDVFSGASKFIAGFKLPWG